MATDLQYHRIRNLDEAGPCNECGYPLDVGDSALLDENEGFWFCCAKCAQSYYHAWDLMREAHGLPKRATFTSTKTTARPLFSGLDCLPGQQDLFNTDGSL